MNIGINQGELAEWVDTMAYQLVKGDWQLQDALDDLKQEGWFALMQLEVPDDVRCYKAFVTTAIRRRMIDWIRAQLKHLKHVQLSAAEWRGVQLSDEDDEPMWRGNIPAKRDYYRGRRHHLEDYFYI